jgi:hypothetical protein
MHELAITQSVVDLESNEQPGGGSAWCGSTSARCPA